MIYHRSQLSSIKIRPSDKVEFCCERCGCHVLKIYKNVLKSGFVCKSCCQKASMKKVDWNRRNEKSKITKFKKYGDENFSNPEKRKSTNLVRFGNEVAMNSVKLRDKIKNKNILKYGSEHFFSSEVGKEKVRRSLNNKTVDEKKAISEKRRQTCLKKYGTNYVVESEYFKKLSKQTCLSNGYKNGGCSPEAMKKIHKKYYYDGRNFDSKPEIAFYIFLKDNNINFEFHPDKSFEYFYEGKSYLYFPDFKVGDEFVEIKGIVYHLINRINSLNDFMICISKSMAKQHRLYLVS